MKFPTSTDDAPGGRSRPSGALSRLGQWVKLSQPKTSGPAPTPIVEGTMEEQRAAAVDLGADLFVNGRNADGSKKVLQPLPNLDLLLLHMARQQGQVASLGRARQPFGSPGKVTNTPETSTPEK